MMYFLVCRDAFVFCNQMQLHRFFIGGFGKCVRFGKLESMFFHLMIK
jgi:hypothetical protein